MPTRLISSVRGIGVAVSVRTSTSALSCFIDSLWLTPNRCSSSMISSPRFLNDTSSLSRRWGPMTRSTSPGTPYLNPNDITVVVIESASSPLNSCSTRARSS